MNKSIYLLPLFLLNVFGCQPAEPSLDERLKDAEQQIDQLGQDDVFSGVVLLTRQEEVLLKKVYGFADLDSQAAITLDTRFNLASMNKMFTAVAIMQLRDDGRIDLQDLVGKHLPDYPDVAVRDSVTIEHLLTHTSGLGDYLTPRFEAADPDSLKSLKGYLSLIAGDPLAFPPGEKFAYSNAGFLVLGLIIESITGHRYYDHIKTNIFRPLKMENSGWSHSDTLVNDLARAYSTADSVGNREENPYLGIIGTSAGGGFSTVGDLLKFAQALKANTLLPALTLAEMKEDRFGHGYGYGFSLRDLNGWKVYGHNGGFPGVSGEVDIFEKDDLIAISLSNRGPRDGWASVRTLLREAIVGETEESENFQNAEAVIATYKTEGLDAAFVLANSFDGKLDERQLIHHAEQFNEAGERAKSIDILSIVVKSFPESWFPISIMADLQMENGDSAAAVENWKKSLELNPDNQWATDRLAELGE